MNISEEGIRAYIERFHETLDDVSSRFFSPNQAKKLLHKSPVPAKIICYLSTQFGVAFEYNKSTTTTVETILGSARIEDLVVQAPKKLRSIGPLIYVDASNIIIAGPTIEGSFPFRLAGEHADVTFLDVKFSCKALKWERSIEYIEVYGNRLAERWSLAQAENRAKDEVLAALFIAKQAETKNISIHKFISQLQEKSVLLLGSYDSAGQQRLTLIAQSLREIEYEPILIKDIPDFEQYSLTQKVIAISALSRFVVVDDSEPSGHLNEVEICKQNNWITILLRAGGIGASWMTAGTSNYSNVILEKEYDPDNPKEAVSEAMKWAEVKFAEMKVKWNTLYPWRTEN